MHTSHQVLDISKHHFIFNNNKKGAYVSYVCYISSIHHLNTSLDIIYYFTTLLANTFYYTPPIVIMDGICCVGVLALQYVTYTLLNRELTA